MGDTNPATATNDPTGPKDHAPGANPEQNQGGKQDQQGQQTATEAGSGNQDEDLSPEDMRAALTAARRESAKYRTERNALRDQSQQAQEQAKVNATDSDRIAALEKELSESRQQSTRATVASTAGVPSELLSGSSQEEMEESAERLNDFVKTKVDAAVADALAQNPTMPQVGGENAGANPVSEDDWLRRALQQK